MIKHKGYLGVLKASEPIHIIGGGISGLSLAFYLKKAKIPFKLFEKEPKLGGKIQTTVNEYGVFEHAANAIYSDDNVFEMISELGLTPITATPKLKKFIWRNGTPTSPPLNIGELIPVIFKLGRKIPNLDIEKMSVSDFFKPLLGKDLTEEVLAPALTGIYAEHVSNLHFLSIFKLRPKRDERYISYFLRLKRSKLKPKQKATSLNFSNGMGELISALRDYIGDDIELSVKQVELNSSNTIIATDATEAAEILKLSHPEISNQLSKIQYSSISLAHTFTKSKVSYLEHAFGMVFRPNVSDRKLIGILSNDQIFRGRVKQVGLHSYSFIMQGAESAENNLNSDLKLIKQTELIKNQVSFHTSKWKRAIPVYNTQRFETINSIEKEMEFIEPGLVIFGNYVGGISLREIIGNAKRLVEESPKLRPQLIPFKPSFN